MTRHTPIPIATVAAYYGVTRPAIRKRCLETGVPMIKGGHRGDVYINPDDIPVSGEHAKRWIKRG